MTRPETIVKYIKDNPGCIKIMYGEQDQDKVDESLLLNPGDWELHPEYIEVDKDEPWINDNINIIMGYWDENKWIKCNGWCDGIIANFDDGDLASFQEA